MEKNILLSLIILICFQFATAQKASDVIENGIHIKTGQKLFLQFDNKVLKFDTAKSLQDATNPPDFITLEDSTIFLINKNAINVYIRPINPINFSYKTENKVIVDPINEAASTALGSITDLLATVIRPKSPSPTVPGSKANTNENPIKCEKFKLLQEKVELIQTKLADNKKAKTVEIFKKLKALDFVDEVSTIATLDTIKASVDEIDNHFKEVAKLIEKARTETKNYDCDFPESFISKYIFNDIIKDLEATMTEQKKRLDNLQRVYNLVKKAQLTASIGGGENGLRWCYKLNEVSSKEGKISIYTITIIESGYKLSDKEEIVSIESKEVLKRTFRTRKFQWLVPEASVGTAFTFLKYYSYGTTSDSTGQQFVGSPTENEIQNLNITTMLNFNFYFQNTPVHPLYQLGIGINSGMPTILTGLGIRSNINGIKRMTISGGIAMTWIKELDKLKVGDPISGTSDIDKDYKFSSAPKFSPYLGIQYNF